MENYGNYFNNNSSSFGGGGGGGEPQLPPGYRFHPTDEELITYYLLKKVFDSSFSGRAIAEVDLNKCEPWHLPEKAYEIGGGKEKEWYLFSLRDRKYPTGLRTNRATEAGYGKATGKDREIYGSKTGSLIGMKKTLVFYRGRAPKGEKTNWVMHEYRLDGKFACHYLARSSKDEWVIARVFHKTSTIGTSKKAAGWVGSPSSSSASTSTSTLLVLPPLLDPSPIIPSADRESSSSSYYDNDNNNNVDQHVPCFSMSHGAATALPVNPNLSSLIFSASDGGGGRNNGGMEENLHLPNWFMSSVLAAPRHQHHQLSAAMPTMQMAGDTSLLDRKVGDTDQLACMWTFYSS